MKTSERHQLKSNEFAQQVARVMAWAGGRGRQLTWGLVAVVAIAVIAGGLWAWRLRGQEQAATLLADAMAVAEMPVLPEAAPGQPAPPPAPGTFPSQQARSEAALAKFMEVVDQYPASGPGVAARYEAAILMASLGRAAEAEQQLNEVVTRDGGVYGRMARMGIAELQLKAGKYDEAIATYRDQAARKDGDVPVDAVLMQLARAYELAGKRAEALQTYQRVVSEFPDSLYAGDARRAADELKAVPGA